MNALHELVAGAPGQQLRLPLEQGFPHAVLLGRVLLPALVDGPARPLGRAVLAGRQAMLGVEYLKLRLHVVAPGLRALPGRP
jgi:hypothetical protein